MSLTYGITELIQQGCAQAIALQPNIAAANIPVLTESQNQVDYELLHKTLGGIGVCIVVCTPSAKAAFKNIRFPYFNNINIRAVVIEMVTQNQYSGGTQITSMALCEYVCMALQLYPTQNQSVDMVPDENTIGQPYDNADYPGCIFRDVNYYTHGGVSQIMPTFDIPTISQVGNTVTISAPSVSSVAVSGASVFYTTTTNGSNPTVPTPLASTVPPVANNYYSSPFTVSTGMKIRFAPFLVGYLTPNLAASPYTCT